MNDNIAKPLDPRDLYAKLLRWPRLREPLNSGCDIPGARRGTLDGKAANGAGFKCDAALHRVAGHPPILERTLLRFVENYAHGLPDLLDTNGSDDEIRERWRKVCHSARGTFGTIGAVDVLAELHRFEIGVLETASLATLAERRKALHRRVRLLVQHLRDAVCASNVKLKLLSDSVG